MQTAIPRRVALGAALLAAATALAGSPMPSAFAAPAPVSVIVNTRAGLATVPTTALGVNHAIWDTTLGSDAVSDLLSGAGVRMMRYPGGSYADIYHWETHTAPGGYVAPNTDFDTFMSGVKRAGGEPMIIANYGTGTAEEAAGWVKYANITKKYGAKYWTIGNENYGNGHYGSAWEADNRDDKSPAGYANEVIAYSTAMKAIDPTIKVGAVLTMPGNWPDGIVGTGDTASWNQTVLSIAGPHIDFADVHWYPGGGNAAEGLTRTEHIGDAVYLLQKQIDTYAGANAGRIKISMTETNVEHGRNTQPGALFLADAYSGLLANGVFTVQWWNVHNGMGPVTEVAGQTDYHDYGLLSSGNCNEDNTVCQPPLNTPFAPYHALKLLSSFVQPGDQMVRAGTNNALVAAHAARRPNGDLTVLLLNKDPENAQEVDIDYRGYTPSSAAPTVLTYANGGTAISTAGSASTLPPYSLTLLTLKPAAAASTAPKAPGQPTVSEVTDRSATISWPAASGAAKYEVYRANGAVSEQLGETGGTSFTVRNLQPGRRYTVNVLARDASGNQSWSSVPLTFTTGAPATSSCKVKFANTNDWGNGYVAAVDITNTSANPINNWTLDFTWPTTWQSVSGGWSATWTQTGTAVKVTGDGPIAANGGTASIGFVGSYSGPNVPPTTFTLNGSVCAAG
ncbi:cellulose binding domain-containing protein [Paractinoplanes rishiriensis]|uniref:Alpha-L-arabinofuranosidase n=1 Tax=Paractinoplanes rishiriensis TaxID=1050105 RepID=A0A919K5L5_9ACTN|nr:cellulose binding domain-containing protein [Actinoplanes rishiriensis]GIF00574.1 alpha-L-arabinofuranosidase [Actinoplanes rishiriensis]